MATYDDLPLDCQDLIIKFKDQLEYEEYEKCRKKHEESFHECMYGILQYFAEKSWSVVVWTETEDVMLCDYFEGLEEVYSYPMYGIARILFELYKHHIDVGEQIAIIKHYENHDTDIDFTDLDEDIVEVFTK